MASPINSFVGRLRGQRAAVPGGSRRDFFGDRLVPEPPAGNIVALARAARICPSCSAMVAQHEATCHCGEPLLRASA